MTAAGYANALYRRGYAAQGWKALSDLAKNALNFPKSRIYPGIPEYFRSDGRGMYHYLTGAASWYLLAWKEFTMDKRFRGRKLHIRVENPEGKESGFQSLWLNH